MSNPSVKSVQSVIVQLAIGLAGSLVALWMGFPLPFLVGSLVATGAYAVISTRKSRQRMYFPQMLRRGFIATIGAMIGTTFTLELLSILPTLWITLLLMVPYIAVTLGICYLFYRHLGRYDHRTAIFSAVPGGLIEAVSFGEQAGADVRLVSLHQFSRLVLVVISVQLVFFIWSGQSVGSAAGQTFSAGPWGASDVVVILVLALLGMFIGPYLRLPAYHLTGPLLLSVFVHATGLIAVNNPQWFLYSAQLIVGTGLGANFSNSTVSQLLKAFGLGFMTVSTMLVISVGFALVIESWVPMSFDELFIAFAPGGVTEMNLIALSLGISPVAIACLHLFRIMLTSALSGYLAKAELAKAV